MKVFYLHLTRSFKLGLNFLLGEWNSHITRGDLVLSERENHSQRLPLSLGSCDLSRSYLTQQYFLLNFVDDTVAMCAETLMKHTVREGEGRKNESSLGRDRDT